MTDIETKRLDLYNVLQEVLGHDPATTLMSHLPPTPIPALLTKAEFEAFRSSDFATFRTQFTDFRTEMREFKTEMHGFQTEMHGFQTEMRDFKTEMHGFQTEMREFKTEMSGFQTEMREAIGEMNKRVDRVLLAVVAGHFVLIAAIVGTSIL